MARRARVLSDSSCPPQLTFFDFASGFGIGFKESFAVGMRAGTDAPAPGGRDAATEGALYEQALTCIKIPMPWPHYGLQGCWRSIAQNKMCMHVCMCVCMCEFVCMYVLCMFVYHLSIYLSIYPSIHPSIHSSFHIYLSVCVCVCVCVCKLNHNILTQPYTRMKTQHFGPYHRTIPVGSSYDWHTSVAVCLREKQHYQCMPCTPVRRGCRHAFACVRVRCCVAVPFVSM